MRNLTGIEGLTCAQSVIADLVSQGFELTDRVITMESHDQNGGSCTDKDGYLLREANCGVTYPKHRVVCTVCGGVIEVNYGMLQSRVRASGRF